VVSTSSRTGEPCRTTDTAGQKYVNSGWPLGPKFRRKIGSRHTSVVKILSDSMRPVASRIQRFRRLLAREDVQSISRRYFVSNGFDGTLTCIGVVVGAVLSGVSSGLLVIKIGLGAAIGLGTSAVWSVWEIERAETRAEILRLEQAMLTDLDDTRIEHEQRGVRAIHATMSGLGPLIGVLVPLSPFALEGTVVTMIEAALVAVGLGVGLLRW
jgi:predicted membrane protein (TIGR00267 family)